MKLKRVFLLSSEKQEYEVFLLGVILYNGTDSRFDLKQITTSLELFFDFQMFVSDKWIKFC